MPRKSKSMIIILLLGTLALMLLLAGCAQQAQTPAPAPANNTVSPPATTAAPADVKDATYGAKSAALKTSWSLEEMLQYAIEDEYMARAEYDYTLKTFGDQNPFANIKSAEETHINALKGLYNTRNMAVPADNSAENLVKAQNIKHALELCVEGEIANINMYQGFLNTPNLPEDVRTVFTQLKAGSESHLSAFKNALSRY